MAKPFENQPGVLDIPIAPDPAATALRQESASTAAAKDIAFGSIAGVIGKIIEYPFDTVKVRLQSQPANAPLRYSGPIDCFRQSFQDGGVRNLYRGISAPMFGAAVETSSLFFSYRLAQELLLTMIEHPNGEKLPLEALMICGGVSGALTSALLTPIELVKCQMQVPQAGRAPTLLNPFGVVASIYRHNGIVGFWRGQLGTLIRETGGSAAWFGSYEGVCAAFRKYDARTKAKSSETQPVWQQLLAGASAGMMYNFICYPADTIKSRMQTEEVGGASRGVAEETFWVVGKDLWKQQGLKGMYRGCGITVARAAPSSAFIFTIYETLLRWTD